MLAWNHRFVSVDASLRRGRWEAAWSHDAPPPPFVPELGGKKLGILGYGRIGPGGGGWGALLRGADYVAITLALTPETRGMIGARQLALMKRSAVLINVARGEVVDEDALYEALAGGTIAGAALDVWYRYPAGPGPTLPSRRPFHELPNVLMTPHVSGWTEGM